MPYRRPSASEASQSQPKTVRRGVLLRFAVPWFPAIEPPPFPPAIAVAATTESNGSIVTPVNPQRSAGLARSVPRSSEETHRQPRTK